MEHFDALIQGDKPVVVHFFADWNESCRIMKPVIEEIKEIAAGNVMAVNVDISRHPHYSDSYNIISIPTIVIFKNGHELWRKVGFAGAEEILRHLSATTA
ncbi:MAG TPA: thioredoxin family protein [Chitinophagaceae bacterium]